ncbi:MAG: hypothetical protein ACRDNS_17720 [Trebonia sp.]
MTITRTNWGVWELRTRHGTLLGTGDLYSVVTLWAQMRRHGRSDVPYGQPAVDPLTGRRTVECTGCHDCRCRACTSPPMLQRSRQRDVAEPDS